jgi:hypothetical protein
MGLVVGLGLVGFGQGQTQGESEIIGTATNTTANARSSPRSFRISHYLYGFVELLATTQFSRSLCLLLLAQLNPLNLLLRNFG